MTNPIFTQPTIKYMVAEAASAGLKFAAHCVTEKGAHNAADAGVASIEHGFEMSNETLELAKKNNVVLVSTDFTEKAWLAYEMPVELAKRFHARSVDRLKKTYKIGVTLAFGSDLIFYAPDETRGTWTMSQIRDFHRGWHSAAKYLASYDSQCCEVTRCRQSARRDRARSVRRYHRNAGEST